MLRSLTIQNYALIDSIHFEPGKGLNIITGETGAGKSILLGALGLVLGDRAEGAAMRDSAKKCIVEAIFDITSAGLESFFDENAIDYENHTVVRREILPGGKSRAFVNDMPVVLPVLKQLGEHLADIHSQHESIGIFEKNRQLQMLDVFANNGEKIKSYKTLFRAFKKISAEIELLEGSKAKADAEADYRNFLFEELEQAKIRPGEFAELEQELEWLGNAETTALALDECIFVLKENEQNALDTLRAVYGKISRLSDAHGLKELNDRIRQISTELDDISGELDGIRNKITADPERLNLVQERIGLLQKLFVKHRVRDDHELKTVFDALDQWIQSNQEGDDKLEALRNERAELWKQCVDLAKQIGSKRQETAGVLSGRVNDSLAMLSLPNATFEIRVESLEDLNESGSDVVSFYFNANKGGTLQTLGKVASGGELSRLMLVLKSILAEKLSLPTLILDEIDSGISGEVALAMARMIGAVAEDMQVIAITHLPQMASKGQHHFHVYKEESGEQTFTRLKSLNADEKLLEVARMISGNEPGESAIAHARDLMQR